MQYPQQPGWNQQQQGGWNQQGYPPQNQNVGYPGGVPQQGGWGGAPQYPAGYGYPGMYPQQGGQPHGMHPGMNPGMYPQQGAPGMYPQHGGVYGAQAQPPPPKKAEIVKPAANPIDALFGAKADPNATQAAAQQRARRISNPPPVQPTPQESKPAPKRAANYNIDLSEEPSDGGLGIPGSARSSTSSATSPSTLPSSSSSSSSGVHPSGVHSSGGSFPPHSGGVPPHGNPAIHSGGGFPPGGHPSGAHPPNAFPGHPGAHPQGAHPGQQHGGHQQPAHQQPGHQQHGGHPGHPGAYPPGGFPQGAHPHGGPGFPPGSFPGHGGFNQYGGFPGGGGYAGYGAPAINKGSFFLPPTGAPSGTGAPPLTPSGPAPLTPSSGAMPLTPATGPTGSSPLPSPSPTISPVSSQGSFQQGFAQPHPTQSQPSHPSQRAQSPLLAATAMHVGQPSLLPSNQIQHAMSPSHFLHSNVPMQKSPSFQQSTPGPGSSPSFSFPSNVSPPRTMQQSASASNVPSSAQFQGATSDDWAGSDFTTPSNTSDDFGGFNAPSNDDFGGFNTPTTAVSSGDFGNFNTPATAVSSGDFGAFTAPSNDDFGFSGFQGASQSPAITVQPPKEQQKDLFDFGTPSTKPTTAHSSPAKPTNLVIDEPTLAPSPKLSRSTKQLERPTDDDDFFGTAAINKRHSASFTPPPAQDLGFFDEPTIEASSTPPATTPEVPKKPANALESMMENSLFKVTHKAPPMAAAQPQQAQQTQQKPSQPAAQPAKESAKKFDWSSQNYRDIFGEAETAATPTPNPAIAQEQFEGFVSASDATGASDEFEFGAFESSANSDPFASSSPPTFVTPQFSSNPSTLFPSDNTFGSQPVSLPSPFGPDSSFGSQPSFPAPNAPGEAFQPSFGAPPSATPTPVAVSTPPPSLVTPPIAAPSSTPTPSPFGGAGPFPSSSFHGSAGSEMFSANRLAPSDPFAPTVDDVPSFDSPFSPPRSATVPAISASSPSLSHTPSATPATVSSPPVSSYPDSEPAFGNFSATRRGSIPKVDDNPFGNAETAFGDFGKHLNNTPPTPANSVVGPPRSPQQVESEPAFGSFFGSGSGSTPSSAQGDEAPAFGDFFGQSKTSTPPTPANTVVQSDRNSLLLNFTFGDMLKETQPPLAIPTHLRQPTRTSSLPTMDFSRLLRSPPTSTNPINKRLSTTTPTESFGSFYGDDSARRTGAQADPALRDFVNQSSSVPPTPANSVDKEGSNSDNFFSGASNNLQPSSTISSYDSILAKPLNTFNYSPSSSVVAPSTKPNGDWGLPSTNSNNNNNNNNNNESPFSTTSKNSNDYFGSPFESTSSSTPFPSSSTSSSTPSTSSTSTTTTSSSNKNFSLHSNEMFGSSFDTSFGNAPTFPLEDSFGSPEVAKPNFGASEEFGTFSSFGGEDFGDFSSTTEFGTSEFGGTSEFAGTTEFGANTEFGDFGPSTPFGEEDITHKPPAAPSLTDLFQSLVQQERLVEANACQGHVKNGTQPSPQELATWTSPNASHTTIAQLKERLVSHPNQAKILKSFSQFEKQSLAAAASINLQSAIESQKSARQFVTAVLEWQSKWEKQLAWCATELAAAQKLTAEICSSSGMQGWDPKKEIFSQEKWATYFKALVEVYRVACRLNAAAQHYNVPPSPHYATLAASWSVLSAMLKVDDVSIDYSEIWEEGNKHSDCALCHVPIVPSERSTPWDGASYHLSCANVWANRISPVPPHVK